MPCVRKVVKLACGHEEVLELRCTQGNDQDHVHDTTAIETDQQPPCRTCQPPAALGEQENRDYIRAQRAYHLPSPGSVNDVYRRRVDESAEDDEHDNTRRLPRISNGGQVPGAEVPGAVVEDQNKDDDHGEDTSATRAVTLPVHTRVSVADVSNASYINPHAPRASLRLQADHPHLFRRQYYHCPPAPLHHYPVQHEHQGQYQYHHQYPPQQPHQGYSPPSQSNFSFQHRQPLQEQQQQQQHYPVQHPRLPPRLRREDAFNYGQQDHDPAATHGAANGYTDGNGAPIHPDWYNDGDGDKENDPERAGAMYSD
ncbi:MAG: hypothetical protein LQ350_004139 [Teloschistes chrysophthalmus]|nr:MAG: hypothetical protein LQ350_004139 [Niorma chrysophthalma]